MAVTVTVAGNDVTEEVDFGSLRKSERVNQEVDTLEFRTKRYGSITFVPEVGQEVIVERGATKIFGGVIVRVTERVEAAKILTYRIQCNDYSQYLRRQLVTERYENTTAAAVIADLIANYTDDGFTTANVVAPQPIASISFNRLTVADCFQKLADAIAHVWYVDEDKDVHFFAKNTETAPFSLSDTSGNYVTDSLTIIEDLSQVRNSVLVQGGEAVSETPRTEYFDGDGTKATFSLASKFDSLPTIEVGGVPQTVGVEFLDDDDSFDVMWNFNEKYVRFTSGNIPPSGTRNIEVTGTYLYPIVVTVPAPISQAAYGIYEYAITDKSIRSQSEAIERALAELESYQNELYDGQFITYEDGLRAGQVLTINSTQRGRNIDVLIQAVTATMRDPEGDTFEYEVKFATLKSIGIVEYLQNQLRSEEVIIDDQETLLNYFPLADSAALSDDLDAPSSTTGPYVWGSFTWGYGVWG